MTTTSLAPDAFREVHVSAGRTLTVRKDRVSTQTELVDLLIDRFGPDPLGWAFVCPNCKDVATGADVEAALAANPREHRDGTAEGWRDVLGQECIGRIIGAVRAPRGTWAGRGCDWAAYGMFGGPLCVLRDDGSTLLCFQPATTVPAKRPPLDYKAHTVRYLARGEQVMRWHGVRVKCVVSRRNYRCYDDTCGEVIPAGTEHEVQISLPWSEAVRDCGARPYTAARCCPAHTVRTQVIDYGNGRVAALDGVR